MFTDRKDAGIKLAEALIQYKDQNAIVLAIPRGGVEVGSEIAEKLNAGFSIIISKKLPFPDNPESGFGAIAEDGSLVILDNFHFNLSSEEIKSIIKKQKIEIEKRIRILRNNKPLPEIKNRIVILVDDGLAMGSTMLAAIELCKKKVASKIIVAVPVSGIEVAKKMTGIADELVVLETPFLFRAVAQVYENWYDVSDEECIEILKNFNG
jgi:putative phosphoribosyl transferase